MAKLEYTPISEEFGGIKKLGGIQLRYLKTHVTFCEPYLQL